MVREGARVAVLVSAAALLAPPPAAADPTPDPGSGPPGIRVTPPVVDGSALPAPRPATPRYPTRQTSACPDLVPSGTRPATADAARLHALATGRGQRVAVIDTGVAPHPRLPRLRGIGDYVAADGNGTSDCDGHGTLVAGIIAAAPAADDGFVGIAPDAEILAIRQTSTHYGIDRGAAPAPADPPTSRPPRPPLPAHPAPPPSAPPPADAHVGDLRSLAESIVLAADAGAGVIGISLVTCVPAGTDPEGDAAVGAALRYAAGERDAVVVAAAGNVGAECAHQNDLRTRAGTSPWSSIRTVVTPAWFDEYVLAVGSVDAVGDPSAFSLAGPWVDVAAPGEDVYSLAAGTRGTADRMRSPDGSTTTIAGTSFAAPVVVGTAALVRERFPDLDASAVRERIIATARDVGGGDHRVGAGVVDPLAALTSTGPGPAHAGAAPVDPAAAPAESSRRGFVTALRWAGGAVFACAAVVGLRGLRTRQRTPDADAPDA